MMKGAAIGCCLVFVIARSLFAASPATVNNDDSCDVMVTPAATLLLPYFEVNVESPYEETTLFTIVNTTQVPQIARITIWTDWSYPLLSINVFLTGYDAYALNLYDLIVRGRVAFEPGQISINDTGERSLDNDANPLLDLRGCDNLPFYIPSSILEELRNGLVTGRVTSCPDGAGDTHGDRAVGYLTVDVVRTCSTTLPSDPAYFASEILFDNVLTGDYEQVSSNQNSAQGGPLVHIRAMPEGGLPGAKPTNFARTFYSAHQNGSTIDRRQPLPSTFAARWISGGGSQFGTSYKIWREGYAGARSGCAVTSNGSLPFTEIVRFDEDENPVTFGDCDMCFAVVPTLPPSSRRHENNALVFPPSAGSIAGWMYFNLDHLEEKPAAPSLLANQSWVTVSMAAEEQFSVDFDAASLDNGCSLLAALTDRDRGSPAIGPAPNRVAEPFATGSPRTFNNDDSCDIKVAPAATLLLPYFEVDLFDRQGETTLFTVTNVTAFPQIARVTLWSDWAYPLLTFNIFLTGYDVQAINLYDVIALGHVAEPGTSSDGPIGRRSARNDDNPLLDLSNCASVVSRLDEATVEQVRNALTTGRITACGTKRVGLVHPHAVGYATIDVVRNCALRMPVDTGYFTNDLLYDNVLIGDYQQVNGSQRFAQASAMVHIRAIPEGGVARTDATSFRRTFYSRLQGGATSDRRQPLPSIFAARWISGGSSTFNTSFKIWREAVTGGDAGCSVSANGSMQFPDIVRFDEDENPRALGPDCNFECQSPGVTLPATSRVNASSDNFPQNSTGAVAGWMYLNLDDYFVGTAPGDDVALQNWVVISMAAEGRYSVDIDATALGNGCSPPMQMTDENGNSPAIGPAPNGNP